jgi:hypothetical protein
MLALTQQLSQRLQGVLLWVSFCDPACWYAVRQSSAGRAPRFLADSTFVGWIIFRLTNSFRLDHGTHETVYVPSAMHHSLLPLIQRTRSGQSDALAYMTSSRIHRTVARV